MSPRRAAAVIAGIVMAFGLVLAVMPLSVGYLSDEVRCGSALQPHYATADVEDIVNGTGYLAQCEDEVSGRRTVAFPLLGAGALILLFLGLTGQHKTRWDTAEEKSVDETSA